MGLFLLFLASVFIGASGSVMDLSVDITSAVNEVVRTARGKGLEISRREAVKSGLAMTAPFTAIIAGTVLVE